MTRFSQPIADEFLEAVRAGASNEVAAAHAKVRLHTVRDWLKGGTAAKAKFRQDVDGARATLEVLAVGTIRKQATGPEADLGAAQYIADKARTETEFERLRELTT